MKSSERKTKLLIGLLVAAGILILRLFVIQVLDDTYKIDADNNSTKREFLYPARGIIYDRNGKILVENIPSYDIMVTPSEVTAFDTAALSTILEIPKEVIIDKMAEYKRYRTRIGYQTLIFAKQVSKDAFIRFSELEFKFPGFSSQVRSLRDYPVNAGGNLLGYISEVDADYIHKHPEYKSGDFAGMTGIEAAREKDLRGEKGYKIYLRDSRNKILDSYDNGSRDKPAIPGKDIVTTIDATLQQYGQELMQNKVGSLIAIEPSTGEILTMVSSPGIDVEVLGNLSQYYSSIVSDPYKPMFNRAVQASYPPGSVFKLVNGLIGLEEGVLHPSDRYPCHQGYLYGHNSKLGCHSHPSPLDMTQAIMMSCNGYFCYVLKAILNNNKYDSSSEAYDAWRKYVCSFGFGSKLGSDFPSELGGNIPTSDYYDKHYKPGMWGFTNIISLSIGQGEIGATPLQIANMCAIIANRGYYYIPHIIKNSENITIDPKYSEKHYTLVGEEQFPKVIDGMWMAVNSPAGAGGTARAAAIPGLDVCGKTGTAQNPHGKDHSVFICFAPRENPQIAVAAYIENAGFGGTWACPIASLLVEKYLKGDISSERKWVEDNMMKADLLPK